LGAEADVVAGAAVGADEGIPYEYDARSPVRRFVLPVPRHPANSAADRNSGAADGGVRAMQQHAVERNQVEQRIVQLSVEHRDLDDVIKRLGDQLIYDQLQLQRLKRRKLLLKDQISWLQRQIDPDVPA
jgi:hypothetical protein